MMKYYCDMCGKEMEKPYTYMDFQFYNKSEENYELCERCYEAIKLVIKERKIKHEKNR